MKNTTEPPQAASMSGCAETSVCSAADETWLIFRHPDSFLQFDSAFLIPSYSDLRTPTAEKPFNLG